MKTVTSFVLFFLCFVAFTVPSHADVFVDDDWAGLSNGTVVQSENGVTGLVIGTDAFAQIQPAVDAASDSETLYLASGNYAVAQVLIEKPLSIIGAGPAQTVVNGTGVDTLPYYGTFRFEYISGNCTVSGIRFENPGLWVRPSDSFSVSIFVGWCDGLTSITNCEIRGTMASDQNWGIYVSGSNDVILNDNDFGDLWKPTSVQQCSGEISVSGNTFHDPVGRLMPNDDVYLATGVWVQVFNADNTHLFALLRTLSRARSERLYPCARAADTNSPTWK